MLTKAKKMFKFENLVNEQIKLKQTESISKLKEELKEIKTIIKIPRLKYLNTKESNYEELLKIKETEIQREMFSSMSQFKKNYVSSAPLLKND